MISPLRFFEIYTAVVLHFTGDSYDYFKFGGKTRVNENSLLKRKDKYFFEKMAAKCANEEMAVGICVSNTIMDKKYIRNFDMNIYHSWIAYRDALDYKFKSELDKYLIEKRNGGGLNTLVEMVYSKTLSQEFIILLNFIMHGKLYDDLDKTDNFLWQELKKSLQKYTPFIVNLWQIDQLKKEKLKRTALGS